MSLPSFVATLVGDPARPSLTPALLAKAAGVLPRNAVCAWLHEGVAADLLFDIDPRAASMSISASASMSTCTSGVQAALREALAGARVDVIVQPTATRRKRLLLADMDSTMIGQECIDELAEYAGLKPQVAAITQRAMAGEIAFEPALRERAACLRGVPIQAVDEVLRHRITLTPGGAALVGTMNAHGAMTMLVSGGFTVFTQAIAAALGFSHQRANLLKSRDGVFTGAVAEPILGREAKRAALLEMREALHLTPADVLAVGDGANDLAMIAEAGLGVAYHAKPAVAAAADAVIAHGDLSALLYAQGYRRSEFVCGALKGADH